jgi:hypothetical protein
MFGRATSTGSAYNTTAKPWHGGESPNWSELAHLLPAELLELQTDSDMSQPIKRLVLKVERDVDAGRPGPRL